MKKKIPKFHILFFSDYTLMGSLFGAVMFSIVGSVSVFGENSILEVGIAFYVISILFAFVFIRRFRRLRNLFLFGVPVKATVTKISVLSMRRSVCHCRVHYSFSLNGEEYKSHSSLSISHKEVSSYKNRKITVLVHPNNPYFSINQDSLDQTVFLFGFIKAIFTPLKRDSLKSNSKNDSDSQADID